jgi:hypothetical protein
MIDGVSLMKMIFYKEMVKALAVVALTTTNKRRWVTVRDLTRDR